MTAWDPRRDYAEMGQAYSWERREQLDAQIHAGGFATCCDGKHGYMPNGRGGGTCRRCGDALDVEEL